ncbi:phosphoribosyltransferase-like protein [Paraburkholderia fungorum]|uniref:phosphoribosyltransferase-like protein n=1 Tax=Paraburkholderia fungorum TaxID=134537 RepID=UPI001C1EBE77|nr:hypothetical protein [Paraburkholderia fungorum]MBU7440926.1 hypothetical protein [Paraburkholderia fungorum]
MVKRVFTRSKQVLAWLGQFAPEDQAHAIALLKAMQLVSADEFVAGIRSRILKAADETDGAVALYSEREVDETSGAADPLFDQPDSPPRRAVGERAVALAGNVDIGSEGLVAQLITELTRANPEKFLNHPGPDLLRERASTPKSKNAHLPVRKFILVTDIIGSGNRAWQYLDAAWRVCTIKSLWSMRRHKGIAFEVVAYAATAAGQQLVETHSVKPHVRAVIPCPTIETSVKYELIDEVKELCRRYDPQGKMRGALGYRDTGALIAFAHGMPNNCPRIFWAGTTSWSALFPKRVTATMRDTFGREVDAESVNDRLMAMRQRRLTESIDWSKAPRGALERYLVLAALAHPPRTSEVVARKTGLTLLEVEKMLVEAVEFDWIDRSYRLTDLGRTQLSTAKASSTQVMISERSNLYYPSSLRAPPSSSR